MPTLPHLLTLMAFLVSPCSASFVDLPNTSFGITGWEELNVHARVTGYAARK